MPQPIADQVEERIRKVEEAANRAQFALQGQTGWFGSGMTSEAEASHSAIKQLREGSINPWSARGRKHARENTDPPGRGWVGWTDQGNLYLEQLPEIEGLAKTGRLQNLEATVVSVIKDTAALPGKAISGAAKTVGEGANTLLSPIFGKLMVVAGIALAGLWLWGKGR